MLSVLTRRAIAFIVAAILAIVAALAVYSYLRGVENRAAEEADEVVGYVAVQRIEPGTLADTAIQLGAVEERAIPRSLLAEGAVTDLSQVTGRVVEEVILPGDQLQSDRFAAPGQQVQVLTIPPDHQAMSVQVGIPPGVSKFLRAGDHISMIALLDVPDPDGGTVAVEDPETGETTTEEATEPRAQFLLQDVEILAVGQRVPPTDEQPAGGTAESAGDVLLTVAVTPDEAEQLAFATLTGELYFTLLPEDETEPVATTGRTTENIFDSGN